MTSGNYENQDFDKTSKRGFQSGVKQNDFKNMIIKNMPLESCFYILPRVGADHFLAHHLVFYHLQSGSYN